jgi:hypothetical protein
MHEPGWRRSAASEVRELTLSADSVEKPDGNSRGLT